MATAKKSSAKKTPAKKSSAEKSSAKKSATAKRAGSGAAKRSNNPSSTGKGKAKKEPAKQDTQCWPGYKPVPGKARGTKGSCEPKTDQTKSEKKSDGMAAAASKLRKAGGNKAKANHSK